MTPDDGLTRQVKQLARACGFHAVGIAPAAPVPEPHVERLLRWLGAGCNAGMAYFHRHLDLRRRPDRLVPGARSVVCLAVGCACPGDWPADAALVARYARGRDYHAVLADRCRDLMARLRELAPDFQGRAFVDSAPVMERTLAAMAGLGWIGRNGCLIVPGLGSFVVLCEVISNLPLAPGAPAGSACGACDLCVRSCPTGAILGDGLVDARRCISYRNKDCDDLPDEVRASMGRWVFGCDVCQEACPHNRDLPAGDPELLGVDGTARPAFAIAEVLRWGEPDWDRRTRSTVLRDAPWHRHVRNAIVAAGNSGQAGLVGPLRELLERHGRFERDVRWALARLEASGAAAQNSG